MCISDASERVGDRAIKHAMGLEPCGTVGIDAAAATAVSTETESLSAAAAAADCECPPVNNDENDDQIPERALPAP
jgi:hypothetical protein